MGSFALGKYEVTFAQWDACVAGGGCKHRPEDRGWGRGDRPVINVSWFDAQAYIGWLNAQTEQTGKRYRLPSEAELEYAIRSAADGDPPPPAYPWGPSWSGGCLFVNGYKGYCANDAFETTAPVGSFQANAFGLHDSLGNVWEWAQDSWIDNYNVVPVNGAARESGCTSTTRVLRGGGWDARPVFLRSAFREHVAPADRNIFIGFRLAQDR